MRTAFRPVAAASRAPRPLAWLLLALAAALLLPAAPAAAADEASIAHVEATDDGLRVLVTVPPSAQVDLAGVTASLDGETLDATAALAESDSVVKRTTILAMDTSDSMAKLGRFEAAKTAANTYLDTVPEDVRVGIVTFDGAVATALEPTTDRDAARAVVAGLELAKGTLLYDGIRAAVDLAGSDGQRSILVLSDGADTGGASTLPDVTAAVEEANTLVDVVALDQRGAPLAALEELSAAGNGRVIEASGDALAEAFASEADLLASQVLVTAPLPEGFDATEATVRVSLPTPGGDLVASALAPIQEAKARKASVPEPRPVDVGWETPGWLLYAGIGVFGAGLFVAAFLLVPRGPQPMTVADRLTAYTGAPGRPDAEPTALTASEPVLDQAKAAAENVLHRNRGLEQRLALRLYAAGSGFKPSEWLLLHIGVVVGAGLLGALIGRGSVVVGLLFVIVGFLVPPLYLRFKAGRRRKAFDANLPETLQLLAGALSAGLSLAQAVDTVVREGAEPIASEFKRVLIENRIGVALEDAFEGVAERFASKDFAWAVMAIRIQRQVGGNLAELLNTVADTMRERQYLRRQVNALAAEGKFSAYILCGLPPAFMGFQLLTNPEYVSVLYTDPLGIFVLACGVLMLAIGAFWMSRMIKVEI